MLDTNGKMALVHDEKMATSVRVMAYLQMHDVGWQFSMYDLRDAITGASEPALTTAAYTYVLDGKLARCGRATYEILPGAHAVDIKPMRRAKRGRALNKTGSLALPPPKHSNLPTLVNTIGDAVLQLQRIAERGSMSAATDQQLLEELQRRAKERLAA